MRGRGGAGQAWVAEYGDPANSTDFPYMLAASPLENIAVPNGTRQYPAVMVGTGAPLARCLDGRRPVRAWDVRPFRRVHFRHRFAVLQHVRVSGAELGDARHSQVHACHAWIARVCADLLAF